MMAKHAVLGLGLLVVAMSGALAVATSADTPGHGQHGAAAGARARQPVRMTMEELHRHGGLPPGWRFTIPPGDPRAGREMFAKLECNKCHAVDGDFPEPATKEPGNIGPALTGMGGHHPPEYIAQSILDPNAVIVTAPGHTGADGLSIMPSFADSLTVAELLDLVAYVASLSTGGDAHEPHAGAGAPEQVVGDYRIRVAYQSHAGTDKSAPAHGAPRHGAKTQPGHAGQHGHGAPGPAPGRSHGHDHLMVFVIDAKTGEPVPYLPVVVTIHAGKDAPRTVKLGPMVSELGFHYGADVTMPATTTKLTVVIGPTAMKVMPPAAGRFGGTARATFVWPR